MNTPRQLHILDYNYPLPDERIAKFPVSERDHSKLLIYRHGAVSEDVFHHLPLHLPKGALMVFNNTKVIQARLHFRKATGALIEIFLLEPAEPSDYEQMFQSCGRCAWHCLVGNLKKWKGEPLRRTLSVKGTELTLTAVHRADEGNYHLIDFEWDSNGVSFAEILDAVGELPIPPYLNRETRESDKTTYQTVYSKVKGSVAAPTAGLHFTPRVLSALDEMGIRREEVTLHVGAGTFKPVKSETIEGHEMHTEHISVKRQTIEQLLRHEGHAIAVGTTGVRTLESLYYLGCRLAADPALGESSLHVNQWEPYDTSFDLSPTDALQCILDYLDRNQLSALQASTQIIIAPGYEYKYVKALITNFHQPCSTLLLLVSAFVNGDWRKIYDYALTHDFRFLSYGDSSLLIP